jgi:hypothetical protein
MIIKIGDIVSYSNTFYNDFGIVVRKEVKPYDIFVVKWFKQGYESKFPVGSVAYESLMKVSEDIK